MIQKFSELIECLKYEKRLYPNTIIDIITKDQRVYNWCYIKLLRKCEYFYNNRKHIFQLVYLLY